MIYFKIRSCVLDLEMKALECGEAHSIYRKRQSPQSAFGRANTTWGPKYAPYSCAAVIAVRKRTI